MEKHVVAGSAVKAGEALYRIADLSVVWVEAEVYEDDIARMEIGQRARIAVQGVPGREFEGTVSYVYPYLDGQTRTGRVRFEVPNPDGALKPEMYADVTAEIPLGERLAVPEGAVIYAGKSHVVFVDLGEGRLEPRRVKIGARTRDSVEIVEGVEEGETVVTSGNFLIAAESKLKSGIEKW
jgi:Cu(I)/Ag(I) efflux system membrane fusion protein